MSERISLSLSPAGTNPAGTARWRPELSPELIAAHVARAHRLRSSAIACLAQQVWHWLTRRSAASSAGDCADADWLRPQTAR